MESSRKPATRRGGQGFILFYFVAPRGGGGYHRETETFQGDTTTG